MTCVLTVQYIWGSGTVGHKNNMYRQIVLYRVLFRRILNCEIFIFLESVFPNFVCGTR